MQPSASARPALVLLGTAGWMPQEHRETSAVAVRVGDRLLVFDAGTGVRRLVADPHPALGLADIRHVDVLLSHFHLDHTVGLSYLFGLPAGPEITVWGPGSWCYGTPTGSILASLVGPPYHAERLVNLARIVDLPPVGMTLGNVVVHVRQQTRHTAPSVAFRLGDGVTYCTDTEYDPANASFAAGSRLLLHEAWHTGTQGGDGHSSGVEAARVAEAAGVGELLLVHLNGAVDERLLRDQAARVFPKSTAASDLTSRRLTL